MIQPNLHYCTAIDKRLNTSKQLIRSTVGVDKKQGEIKFPKTEELQIWIKEN